MRWWSNSACLKTLVRSTSHAAIAFIKLWHFSRFDASLPDSECLKSMQNMQVLNLRPCTMLLGGAAAMQSYHMLLWSTMVRTWTCHVLFSTCHPETYSGLILLKWWQLLKAWKYFWFCIPAAANGCDVKLLVCSNKILCAEVVKAV